MRTPILHAMIGVDSMDLTLAFSTNDRLNQQLGFLAELDKLKDVLRRSLVGGSRRNENSAEHSWHLAMMSLVLMEQVRPGSVDQLRVLKMLLVHDIVEIDAGDTFCYDTVGNVSKSAREQAAALRIFGLLPTDQTRDMRGLWDEFEAGDTLESKWAQCLDRLQPILQNLRTGGASWRKNSVTKAQVLDRNKKIGETMPEVWAALVQQIDLADSKGYFEPEK